MPFIRTWDHLEFSADSPDADWERQIEAVPFEYDPIKAARLDGKRLDGSLRVLVEAMVRAGATEFRVRYDGGNDEGFSYPEWVKFGEEQLDVKTAVERLSTPELAEQLRRPPLALGLGLWGRLFGLGKVNGRERAPDARPLQSTKMTVYIELEAMAERVAMRILGEGFGTGEYELYGAVTVDLRTGAIVDDPNAVRSESLPGFYDPGIED